MARTIRIPFRDAAQAERTAENAVCLVEILHPDLEEPIRLSDDPTVRLSLDPLVYGTRSRLLGTVRPGGALAQPGEFLFALMTALVPEDREEGVVATQIQFEAVSADIVDLVRSVRTPATVHFAVVLASSPDHVDFEWTDLRTLSAEWDDATVTLTISREERSQYAWPFPRMTRERFPGLNR